LVVTAAEINMSFAPPLPNEEVIRTAQSAWKYQERGQAVVCVVGGLGRGDCKNSEEQPYAKQIAHALEPALLRPDENQLLLHVARDGERTMQDAWRQSSGRAKGK
jgi:hypothetical protein